MNENPNSHVFFNQTFCNLVEAIRQGQVVAFVGAGVTRAVRCTPGWGECIDGLFAAVETEARAHGFMTHRFAEYIEALKVSAKEDPLFAAEQCRKYLQERFPQTLREIIDIRREGDALAARGVEVLLQLPFFRVVTTNYDDLLWDVSRKCHPGQSVQILTHRDTSSFAEFLRTSDSEGRRALFHLHGHFDYSESLVLTELQYQELYAKREVTNLLEAIFSTKSALFIGFSLEDLDVMQVFRRITSRFPSVRERHFAIVAKRSTEPAAMSWVRALRHNYKYGVGLLYYDVTEGSHDGLWRLVAALSKALDEERKLASHRIGILIDKGFPYSANLFEIVAHLNKVQSLVSYCIRDDVEVDLADRFDKRAKGTFEPLKKLRDENKDLYDGIFLLTNKRESSNYLFFDRKFGGFISTQFWSEFVGKRPSIDEFLLHTLVLLTLHFYDQKFNRTEGQGKKVLTTHSPDEGCLFDLTVHLRNRIAIIDYPYVCDGCKDRVIAAFHQKGLPLDLNWIRTVLPIVG